MPGINVVVYGLMRWIGMPLPAPQVSVLPALLMSLAFFVGALGEELGWSGYALDPMQDRWSAVRAGITLGVVAVIWHRAAYSNAALFHATLNITYMLFPIYGSHFDMRLGGLIMAFAAAAVTVVWGPKTLVRHKSARSSAR